MKQTINALAFSALTILFSIANAQSLVGNWVSGITELPDQTLMISVKRLNDSSESYLYKSTDNGESWAKNQTIPGVSLSLIKSFGDDVFFSSRVWNEGKVEWRLYKSSDQGKNLNMVIGGSPTEYLGLWVESLEEFGDKLYLTIGGDYKDEGGETQLHGNVFVSPDRGETWSELPMPQTNRYYTSAKQIAQDEKGHLYLHGSRLRKGGDWLRDTRSFLWKSIDNGQSWQVLDGSPCFGSNFSQESHIKYFGNGVLLRSVDCHTDVGRSDIFVLISKDYGMTWDDEQRINEVGHASSWVYNESAGKLYYLIHYGIGFLGQKEHWKIWTRDDSGEWNIAYEYSHEFSANTGGGIFLGSSNRLFVVGSDFINSDRDRHPRVHFSDPSYLSWSFTVPNHE